MTHASCISICSHINSNITCIDNSFKKTFYATRNSTNINIRGRSKFALVCNRSIIHNIQNFAIIIAGNSSNISLKPHIKIHIIYRI